MEISINLRNISKRNEPSITIKNSKPVLHNIRCLANVKPQITKILPVKMFDILH